MLRPIISAIILVTILGCAPAKFSIVKAPSGRTPDQQTLDSTQCSQQSKVDGPWLYGVGTAVYWNMAKSRYRDCMNAQGYEVKD